MTMLSKADYYLSMLIEYKSSTTKSNEKATFSSTSLHPQSMGASFRLWFDNLTLTEKEELTEVVHPWFISTLLEMHRLNIVDGPSPYQLKVPSDYKKYLKSNDF